MGEYAKYEGQEVKIGTCENMYYLRLADRHKVRHLSGNVNVNGSDVYQVRFRFPWPDEDAIAQPGHDNAGHDFDRSLPIASLSVSAGVDHYPVQFTAQAGYLLTLTCPEGPTPPPGIHRNGFAGAVHLCQEKLLKDGRTVPILKCGGCGGKYRLEETGDIEELVVTIRKMADHDTDRASFLHTIADRIAIGAKLHEEATTLTHTEH